MILSIDEEKAYIKKNFYYDKLEMQRKSLNLIKGIDKKSLQLTSQLIM